MFIYSLYFIYSLLFSVIIWPVTGHGLITFAPIQLNAVLEVMTNIPYVLK